MFDTGYVLVLLAAVLGSSAMVGIVGWTWGRLKRLEERRPPGTEELRRLSDEVDAMREELVAARKQLREIADRTEFTERLLTKGPETGDSAG